MNWDVPSVFGSSFKDCPQLMIWAGVVHSWQCNGLGEPLGSMFSFHPNKEVFGGLTSLFLESKQASSRRCFFLGKKDPGACLITNYCCRPQHWLNWGQGGGDASAGFCLGAGSPPFQKGLERRSCLQTPGILDPAPA